MNDDAYTSALMSRALELAEHAAALGEVPVGAVVAHDGVIVGQGYNRREIDRDPLAHAELIAIAQASKSLGRWRLFGCTLVVTLEPCFMCAGALINARVDRLVFGAMDPKAGAVGSLANLCADPRLNHRLTVVSGVQEQACSKLLKAFFSELRAQRT